jgi:hypothetical protein
MVYRLGVTRRCLSCGHSLRQGLPKDRRETCTIAFDKLGWVAYNAWRRSTEYNLLTWPGATTASEAKFLEELFSAWGANRHVKRESLIRMERLRRGRLINNTHDCIRDCDYLSQCAYAQRLLEN